VARYRGGERPRSPFDPCDWPEPPASRGRARDLGIEIGLLPPGDTNSIVDVPGVRVGHVSVWRNEPARPDGRGVARTGVTAILPDEPRALLDAPASAGVAVLNGTGELTGKLQIDEWGTLETPVLLTSTMAVGRVFDGVVSALITDDPDADCAEAIIPSVGECDDGYLNDSRTVQVDVDDVRLAIREARGADAGAPGVGAVGSGTGMICHELKGGIGTASRIVRVADGAASFTVGVLAMTNYGLLRRLTIDGVPVGRVLSAEGWPETGLSEIEASEKRDGPRRTATGVGSAADAGSCIVVVATDAPLDGRSMQRLARRAGLGLARTGSTAGHGSGDIFLAFSTGLRYPVGSEAVVAQRSILDDRHVGWLFGAVVEATEEAVIDSLVAAGTVVGRDGNAVPGLPHERTLELLERAGRLTRRAAAP
jgi:D-aminopeptidase